MDDKDYFRCASCGQVVEGFIASQQIICCEDKDMRPIAYGWGDLASRPVETVRCQAIYDPRLEYDFCSGLELLDFFREVMGDPSPPVH